MSCPTPEQSSCCVVQFSLKLVLISPDGLFIGALTKQIAEGWFTMVSMSLTACQCPLFFFVCGKIPV